MLNWFDWLKGLIAVQKANEEKAVFSRDCKCSNVFLASIRQKCKKKKKKLLWRYLMFNSTTFLVALIQKKKKFPGYNWVWIRILMGAAFSCLTLFCDKCCSRCRSERCPVPWQTQGFELILHIKFCIFVPVFARKCSNFGPVNLV